MHTSGQCPGIARQRFAGSFSGCEDTGYRFSPATGRPRQSGPRGSARGVARTPRTIATMTPDTDGTPRCGAAGIAGEKPSECGPLVNPQLEHASDSRAAQKPAFSASDCRIGIASVRRISGPAARSSSIPPAISPATGPVVTGSVSRAVHGGRPDPAFLSLGDRRLAPFDAAATPASDAIPVGSRPTIGQSGVAFSGASSG
jgi:hypothetical protein